MRARGTQRCKDAAKQGAPAARGAGRRGGAKKLALTPRDAPPALWERQKLGVSKMPHVAPDTRPAPHFCSL